MSEVKELQSQLFELNKWLSVIGKLEHSAAKGVGHFFSAGGENGYPTIHYQERDGEKNYHEMPRALRSLYESVVKDYFLARITKAMVSELESEIAASADDEIQRHKDAIQVLSDLVDKVVKKEDGK